jgi:hypothetical protein
VRAKKEQTAVTKIDANQTTPNPPNPLDRLDIMTLTRDCAAAGWRVYAGNIRLVLAIVAAFGALNVMPQGILSAACFVAAIGVVVHGAFVLPKQLKQFEALKKALSARAGNEHRGQS